MIDRIDDPFGNGGIDDNFDPSKDDEFKLDDGINIAPAYPYPDEYHYDEISDITGEPVASDDHLNDNFSDQ